MKYEFHADDYVETKDGQIKKINELVEAVNRLEEKANEMA